MQQLSQRHHRPMELCSFALVHPSLLAGDLLQAPDPDRTGSGGAEKMKWGSIDAPREADPGHVNHGRYNEIVYESAASKVMNSTSSNSSLDPQDPRTNGLGISSFG